METTEQKNTLNEGDTFEMFSMSEEGVQPVKVLEITGESARVICGSQPTTLPVDLISKLDRV